MKRNNYIVVGYNSERNLEMYFQGFDKLGYMKYGYEEIYWMTETECNVAKQMVNALLTNFPLMGALV